MVGRGAQALAGLAEMRKIAIVGRCWSTRSDAPWNSPDWELWTLAWDPVPKTHRMFEMHLNFRTFLGSQEEGDFHVSGLRMSKVPVYMWAKHDDIPMSVKYPMDAVHKLIGSANGAKTPYLESSIAQMFALALLETEVGDRIAIYGVDLHCDTEYAFQRPNLEYLIGLGRGMGRKVIIPPHSALLTHEMGKPYGLWSSTDAGAPQTPLPQSRSAA